MVKFIEETLIFKEIENFNIEFLKNTSSSIPEFEDVLNYVFSAKGKQIRPISGILFAKMLGNYNEKQQLFLQSIELIHNATLFHDDVIDEAEIRHNQPALHKKFTNKIAVLTGDYFLSSAIKNIYSLKNQQINELFSGYMKEICEGEIEQNYSLNKIISMKEYINKTRKKTALLFELTTAGITYLSENHDINAVEQAKNFGVNFGIAFQIKDDYNNFLNYKDKPVLNDLKSGIITAPVIFLAEENNEINKLSANKEYEKILSLMQNSDALEKTKLLIKKYTDKAEESLSYFENNNYNSALKDLLTRLK